MFKSVFIAAISFAGFSAFASAGGLQCQDIFRSDDDRAARAAAVQSAVHVDLAQQALQAIADTEVLESKLDFRRNLDGNDESASVLAASQRIYKLRIYLRTGTGAANQKAIQMYRNLFRTVEIAAARIQVIPAEKSDLQQKLNQGHLTQAEANSASMKLDQELSGHYRSLATGLNEYKRVRAYLQSTIAAGLPNDEDALNTSVNVGAPKSVDPSTPEAPLAADQVGTRNDPATVLRWAKSAKFIYQNLGLKQFAQFYPELGIDPNVRPSIDDVKASYKSIPEVYRAQIEDEISKENKVLVLRMSYLLLQAAREALPTSKFPGLSEVASNLFALSNDEWCMSLYAPIYMELDEIPATSGIDVLGLLKSKANSLDENEFWLTLARDVDARPLWLRMKAEALKRKDLSAMDLAFYNNLLALEKKASTPGYGLSSINGINPLRKARIIFTGVAVGVVLYFTHQQNPQDQKDLDTTKAVLKTVADRAASHSRTVAFPAHAP